MFRLAKMKAAGFDSYHGAGKDVVVSLCRSLSFILFAHYLQLSVFKLSGDRSIKAETKNNLRKSSH